MKKALVLTLVLSTILAWAAPVLANELPEPEIRDNKVVNTSLKRAFDWTISKSADQTTLTLEVGQTYPVNYTVTVNADYVDSDWAAYESFYVYNPTPNPITITSVSDVISPDIKASVQCPYGIPFTLPYNVSFLCFYHAALPDGSSRTNTATATIETVDGVLNLSRSLDFDFGNALITDETDECIEVNDSLAGPLGDVCYGDAPKTFDYVLNVGPFDTCGEYSVENVASFNANDTSASGSANWTVNVSVPCDTGGCSLTPGYWKTHSAHGPAPYDATWAELSNGADTLFFDTGKSWHNVLWTPPKGGNAYYILAHAYIAAYLNDLNGADVTVISDEMATAASLLDEYDGAPKAMSQIKGQVRKNFIQIAKVLDDYNNGLIGPGHCSE